MKHLLIIIALLICAGLIMGNVRGRYSGRPQILDAIYAELSDRADQTFGSTGTAQSITFDTNDEVVGITHSTSSNTENITIETAGVYYLIAQPQIHAGAGGGRVFPHVASERHWQWFC